MSLHLARRIRAFRTYSLFCRSLWDSVKYDFLKHTDISVEVKIRIKQLGGKVVVCRSRSTDHLVVRDTFLRQFHLPHIELPERPVILDLGSNIGLTVAHYACLYPGARIYGCEMDLENYNLALKNTSSWKEQITLVNAAVWTKKGIVNYGGKDQQSYRIVEEETSQKQAMAVSIESIMSENRINKIDFVKMDIEGAEQHVLRSSLCWAMRVNSMKVEVHNKSCLDEEIALLEEAGFKCWEDHRHWSTILAVREMI
jgi:FkbM family methyltransferase